MFVHCISLTTIYCDSDWSSRSSSLVTDGDLDMFKDCLLLSNYSESNVNINYANANTGYFTGRTMKNIYNSYKTDNTKIGIDVSRWQGDINFDLLKENLTILDLQVNCFNPLIDYNTNLSLIDFAKYIYKLNRFKEPYTLFI